MLLEPEGEKVVEENDSSREQAQPPTPEASEDNEPHPLLEPEGQAVSSRSVGPNFFDKTCTTAMIMGDPVEAEGTEAESEEEEGGDENAEVKLHEDFIDDVARGMIFSCLAITDDGEETLQKVGKTNPWQVEAMKMVTGSAENAHKPLTTILKDVMHMDMELDEHIDVSGITIGGHFLDTQGYIAHNDKYIVLSYRCTTSTYDWLTNFNATSSAWEPEEDLALGFSGFCSGFEGLCCVDEYKPRVHTGFYNNFLATLPMIQKHIDPLLGPDQPPRTLFVTGHSLGGGVASIAACYFLLKYDWKELPHSFRNVTAGSPRACAKSMKKAIEERLNYLGDSVHLYRIVKGRDVVATVPPSILGFQHMIKPVVIKDDGEIVLKKNYVQVDTDATTLIELAFPRSINLDEEEGEDEKSKYDNFVAKVPRSLRDHMPDFYLKPIFQAKGIKIGAELDNPPVVVEEPEVVEDDNKGEAAEPDKDTSDSLPKRRRRRLQKFFKRRTRATI